MCAQDIHSQYHYDAICALDLGYTTMVGRSPCLCSFATAVVVDPWPFKFPHLATLRTDHIWCLNATSPDDYHFMIGMITYYTCTWHLRSCEIPAACWWYPYLKHRYFDCPWVRTVLLRTYGVLFTNCIPVVYEALIDPCGRTCRSYNIL